MNGDPVCRVISLFHWGYITIFTGETEDADDMYKPDYTYQIKASLHPE